MNMMMDFFDGISALVKEKSEDLVLIPYSLNKQYT